MKAIVWTKYGPPDGLQFREVPKPVPKDNEVLIKTHATTVTAGDCEARSLRFPIWLAIPMRLYTGPVRPRDIILGQELAGEVEAVGKDVTRFKPGDSIFGTTGFHFGGYAQYVCLSEQAGDGVLAIKPANMTCDEAAAVPTGGLEALHFLRKANIQPGQQVLINGAGGSIGTFGVQLARHFGAEVTAVDSAGKLDMLRSLGANHVIDYAQEDFTHNGQQYDAIFDVIGKAPFPACLSSLKPNGFYLLANPSLGRVIRGRWALRSSNRKIIYALSGRMPEDLAFLRELIEAGEIETVIDRRYPLEQTAEAHRYVETGQKAGNLIITIPHDA